MNSDSYQVDILVIGAGPAGQKGAIQGVRAGKKVLMVEQDSKVGGACVHQGTIPSKTLRETAVALVGFRRRSANVFDVHMTEETQVVTLMKRLEQVVRAHEHYMEQQLKRNNVELWHGRARFISPNDVEITSINRTKRLVHAKTILIATGSRPRVPADINVDHEHILDSDSILSMIYLPSSLTVLGSGVIACEYASIFSSLGVKVTIIDKGDRPVSMLDPELTKLFVEDFERNGSRFLGNRKIESVRWNGINSVITALQDGEIVESQKCLFALGRVANLNGLNIEAAGLTVTDRGILPVNEFNQTIMPHIYAAGDVVGPPSLASSSMDQGRRAMAHANGLPLGLPPEMIPTGIYTVPEMSCVGLTEAEAIKRHGGCIVGRARFSEIARGQIAEIQNGLLKLVCDPTGKKLLGIHIFGEGATDLIHVGQMALSNNCPVDTFIDNIFNFPTLTEAYRGAALDVLEQRTE